MLFCGSLCAFLWLLFEQLRKRLPSIVRRSRRRLAFDHGSRCEKLALVARVLVYDACSDWFTALEVRARIEITALTASVEIGVAL